MRLYVNETNWIELNDKGAGRVDVTTGHTDTQNNTVQTLDKVERKRLATGGRAMTKDKSLIHVADVPQYLVSKWLYEDGFDLVGRRMRIGFLPNGAPKWERLGKNEYKRILQYYLNSPDYKKVRISEGKF